MTALIAWKPNCKDITTASFRLRALMPYQQTKKQGWPVEFFDIQNSHQYKIVIFQKAYTKEDYELAKRLKLQGTTIVFDMCDNHFYNPENNEKYARRAIDMQHMIDIADHVIVTTDELGKLISKETIFQIDDYIDEPEKNIFYKNYIHYKIPRRFKKAEMTNRLKLVWFGNAGIASQDYGLKDVNIVLPELAELNKTIPLSLTIISNSPLKFGEMVGHEHPFPTMYCEWKKHYFSHQLPFFDICLIPAGINPYTRVKTNNRVVLSLGLGVPVIASPLPSYLPFSPYIDFENWQESIEKIVTAPTEASRKVLAGQDYIKQNYSLGAITQQWIKLLSYLCLEHGIINDQILRLMTPEKPRTIKQEHHYALAT